MKVLVSPPGLEPGTRDLKARCVDHQTVSFDLVMCVSTLRVPVRHAVRSPAFAPHLHRGRVRAGGVVGDIRSLARRSADLGDSELARIPARIHRPRSSPQSRVCQRGVIPQPRATTASTRPRLRSRICCGSVPSTMTMTLLG